MSDEIHIDYPSAYNLYAVVRNSAGNVWYVVGEVFEAWGTGSRDADDYDIAMVDKSGSRYVGTFDANISTAGIYSIQIFRRIGANPADTDRFVGGRAIYWDGTAEMNIYTIDTSINDDIIGADGDTLESLSDQMDVLSGQQGQVFNVYGVGE